MKINRKHEILLSVLSILTFIATAIGVSFAYFTTEIEGTAANVGATSAIIGSINFDDGAEFESAVDVEPGWSAEKSFTITVAPSDVSQIVHVGLDYTNGLHDFYYYLYDTPAPTDGSVDNRTAIKTGIVPVNDTSVIPLPGMEESQEPKTVSNLPLLKLDFPISTETQTSKYYLKLEFKETGVVQNESQARVFSGIFNVQIGDSNGAKDIYYTTGFESGTPNIPSATN